jgi:hemolysin activation/secretion protein
MAHRNWQKTLNKMFFVLFLTLTFTANYALVSAYDEDAGDDDQSPTEIESNLAKKREKSPIVELKERLTATRPKPTLPSGKTLIREVKITGSTLLADEAVLSLKAQYTNKEATGQEMQRTVDLITRAYSRRGFINSYAYIVADRLAQGILEIMVVEGKTGKIEVKGNKNFSAELLKKKLSMKEGQLFNFKDLSIDVYRINRHPDRKAKLELAPGQDPKFTNITLLVKDKSPLHATLQMDNYGAETILYQRYKIYLIHNNISGHDDSLTAKVEWSQGDSHKIYDLDYIIPLNNNWKFEYYIMPYKSEDYYYKDNKDTDFEKRARKSYFWFYQSLINEPDCELISGYNFTYMDIFWYKPYQKYDERVRRDSFRILRWNLALNKADKYGRWVITNDLQFGIPRMWGGAARKTDETSIVGSSGAYKKNLLTVARRQKLFAGIDFITRARWQLSATTITGVNGFSVGGYQGVIDNRGYPRTQAPGDAGRAITVGFTFPAYLVPKNLKIPYSSTKLYDSLKLFTFYDWGQSILKSPKLATTASDPNDKKITTLRSAGCGLTFAVPDHNLSIRADFGWPLSHQMGDDGDHFHGWFSVTKGF